MNISLENKKIALICDWINDWGGAELVLSHILEIFPQADIYTSVFWQEKNPIFVGRNITPSFIQKIPFLNKSHKMALTLRPLAFESFDLSQYDIVISSSSAESKGVITKPDCLHICYCHTPTRYFWSHYHEYMSMMEFGILNPLAKWLMPKLIHRLRKWDFCAAQRPDYFLANSENTAQRIKKYYNRDATVLYPGIEIPRDRQLPSYNFLSKGEMKLQKDFYLAVGRCIPYKKFDLLIEAFNKNGKKLVCVTNTDNKLYQKLKKISGPNIEWKL
jgi:glycosyltransferase involved in cell wall biosynthesis